MRGIAFNFFLGGTENSALFEAKSFKSKWKAVRKDDLFVVLF